MANMELGRIPYPVAKKYLARKKLIAKKYPKKAESLGQNGPPSMEELLANRSMWETVTSEMPLPGDSGPRYPDDTVLSEDAPVSLIQTVMQPGILLLGGLGLGTYFVTRSLLVSLAVPFAVSLYARKALGG